MDDAYIKSILADCDSKRYPSEFIDEYEPFACLAHSDICETLLVKHKHSGLFYVAKCYADKAVSGVSEASILKKLQHKGLPRFIGEYENNDMFCVVREYIEGETLAEYIADQKPGEERVVSLMIMLCEILIYLHKKKIIHRDIKPQNLIIDTTGQLWLIDFSISRVYDKTAENDTRYLGTKNFAAPEQYGYAQTDARTDIYSLGILIGWMLTTEVKRDSMLQKITNKRLMKIVNKCTSFDPASRYPSVDRLLAGLKRMANKDRIKWRTLFVLACLAFFCVGFSLGRFSGIPFPIGIINSGGITFEEPLIREAVTKALGKNDNERITGDDLLTVRAIYIFGNCAAADEDEYNNCIEKMICNDKDITNGGLVSLNDLSQMKNLECVRISLENISDVTPLSGLDALTTVDLRHNPISDIAPLAGLPRLSALCLFDTRISDISPLSGMFTLRSIDIGMTSVNSLAPLTKLSGLYEIYARRIYIQSLKGIETLASLETIAITEVADGDLTPLLSLPSLETAYLGESLEETSARMLESAKFDIVYQ